MLDHPAISTVVPGVKDRAEVADAIAKLVATPAGQRPLRTLVGQDAQAATTLNQVAEQAQEVLMEMVGLSDLMSMSSTALLVA